MQIKPLGDRVIIKALEEEQISKSGIVLPDTADKEKPEQGEVIAAGPGKRLDNGEIAPLSVKVGDKVVFRKYSADEIKINDEEVLVVSESDIVGIIE
ncbi:MAG: co-chaperone GroES [Parcubacteria group bacterium CG1_02_41_12]|nr:MAG: co-chaperone GroES [Parcubacteria group bacterium CG1_02_41_12]PIP66810.1 MAG: co-chaperone GroES [Parcubacteria group bacterium CG22_combo_CG10-13_8_21_14_all_41_9]PIQ79349.1 MAG: co-chaperone GroES [Parcubacteria group bacterium CG11_big_fil_rev_8_21_14_0_20_41_14]PIR57570.1 MAG: co-chaperone GroES [Parcubacteria group bacterium CG10_big_fil_rev_8_21_14_0_10_41_35]PIZ82111.1 MAG: co-chaperone GroES [Parcubacteria group bacterium CG_4_10_14_0_2_um_filter_41_6]